jgi:hypothetical protein
MAAPVWKLLDQPSLIVTFLANKVGSKHNKCSFALLSYKQMTPYCSVTRKVLTSLINNDGHRDGNAFCVHHLGLDFQYIQPLNNHWEKQCMSLLESLQGTGTLRQVPISVAGYAADDIGVLTVLVVQFPRTLVQNYSALISDLFLMGVLVFHFSSYNLLPN